MQSAEAAIDTITALAPELLQRAVDEHLLWLQSNGLEGARAQLRGVDFRQYDLRGIVLAGADLRGCDFSGAILASADLHEANLERAKFEGANLEHAVLFAANAQYADFSHATLKAVEASSADFSHAMMVDAQCAHAMMDGCAMHQADLRRANFSESDLQGISARGANCEATDFNHANLRAADLREAICDRAQFDGANLTGAALTNAKLEGVALARADFLAAAELSPQMYSLIVAAERARSEQERQAAQEMLQGVERERAKLMQRRAVVAQWRDGENEFIVKSTVHSVWMKYLAVCWSMLAVFFTGMLVYQASQISLANLRIVELGVVMSAVLGITALFVASALRANYLQHMLKDYAGFFRARLHELVNIEMQHDAVFAAAPRKAAAATALPPAAASAPAAAPAAAQIAPPEAQAAMASSSLIATPQQMTHSVYWPLPAAASATIPVGSMN